VLWVLNSGGKVARGRGKSIRRGRGMTSSRALSKQFELNKISYATQLSSTPVRVPVRLRHDCG
jgi:hypothetical protein